mgnify:CR=1 FL=1
MSLFRRHPVLATLFAIALILTLVFAGRVVTQVVYWSDPDRKEQAVDGWMTLRYVAKSWRLAPLELYEAAGLPPQERGSRRTLEQLAKDKGIALADLIADVEAGIVRLTRSPAEVQDQ